MVKIIPAILPSSYRAVEEGVEKVHDIVLTIQIDFVDGYFAPNKTWMFNGKDTDVVEAISHEQEGLPYWDEIDYEFDLMVQNPLEKIDQFLILGPAKIILHLESLDEEKTLKYFESIPQIVKETISFGIAIGIDTDPEKLKPYLEYIDTIQCMGIEKVGFQGHPFDVRVLEQIRKVKNLYPDKNISVDGAVSLDNAKSLVEAGANSLVVGSAVFHNPDPVGTIKELEFLCQSQKNQTEKI
jgi:ribulose-phosphate 3-epimerase